MSKFMVFSCSNVSSGETGNNYTGDVAILACANDPSLLLFFPISKENAELLSYLMKDDSVIDINMASLGIYQTMINSWLSSDRYLSGIVMDMVFDPKIKDYVMEVKLAISTKYGALDSMVKVNIVHAILLSVMEGTEIIVTNELLDRLMPDEDEGGEGDEDSSLMSRRKLENDADHFPQDQNILKIVKNIMQAEEKNTKTTTTKTTTLPPSPSSKRKTKKTKITKTTKTTKNTKKDKE